jgi:hypothetical protein
MGQIHPRTGFRLDPGVKNPSGKQVYTFTAWIDAPADVTRQVESVKYFFDHPSFVTNNFVATRGPDFRISYQGWGCITRVVVTVTFRPGRTAQTEFDQCAALKGAEHMTDPRGSGP